jgi:hypothetical protein
MPDSQPPWTVIGWCLAALLGLAVLLTPVALAWVIHVWRRIDCGHESLRKQVKRNRITLADAPGRKGAC